MLTKSDYLAYTQCPKRFWLSKHLPSLATPPDLDAQRRLKIGQSIDRVARNQHPDGIQIKYLPDPNEMAQLTEHVIADGADTIFQATFNVRDLLIKADILSRSDTDWNLIEVKSTTKVKEEEHMPDVAFQLYVLKKAGPNVNQANVMHLNKECHFPDLSNLFTLTNILEEARAILPLVETGVDEMRNIAVQTLEPEVAIGRHCTKPRTCPFYEHCWRDIRSLTIFDIPRLNKNKEQLLINDGVLYLEEITVAFPLTDKQQDFVDLIVREEIKIDSGAIHHALESLDYPLCFFDFETINHAIPIYEGCTPYQQVPFQYSCHILQTDGTLTHHEYLHMQPDDPRPKLIESLLEDIGESGHLIAYYAPFERRILRGLAEAFPDHEEQLLNMVDRLWDQLDIFKKHYRHYAFGKSNSLKSVLPVVVPELSYGDLSVQDGTQAEVVWERLIKSENIFEKDLLATQLLDYCRLDTLAMVEIHRRLASL